MFLRRVPIMPVEKFSPKDDVLWKGLLRLVETGHVVPLIGPELLQIRLRVPTFAWTGSQALRAATSGKWGMDADEWLVPWEPYLASTMARALIEEEKLERSEAEKLKIWPEADLQPLALNVLVGRLVRANISEMAVRTCLINAEALLRQDPAIRPSPLLVRLAEMRSFPLTVTVGLGGLLEKARQEAKVPEADSQGYFYKKPAETDVRLAAKGSAVIFHLFGLLSDTDWEPFAMSDNDVLEWVQALLRSESRPQRLFDTLHGSHVMLLGCGFPDWLGRLMLRLTRNEALDIARKELLYGRTVVESNPRVNTSFKEYLDFYSRGIYLFQSDLGTFVETLADRWKTWRSREGASLTPAPAPSPKLPLIFLSYARDDESFSRRFYEALRKLNLRVWFDQAELGIGAQWEPQILESVRECTFFVPVVSANALKAEPGRGVLSEWNTAEDRYRASFKVGDFILPVVIDDTPLSAPKLLNMSGIRGSQWRKVPAEDREEIDKVAKEILVLVRKRQTE